MVKGDDANFDELVGVYQKCYAGLVKYLQRILRDSSGLLAEDIAQDTFAVLVRKWPEVRNHPNIMAWLHMVARRLAIKKLKDRSHEFSMGDLDPDHAGAGESDPLDSHVADMDLWKAISKLSARQREVIWLFHFKDFKQDEIATIMQIKRSTVGALLSQARSRLAGLMG
jgi:RNA polymerase sigma-70 factor (ECF subfamily)